MKIFLTAVLAVCASFAFTIANAQSPQGKITGQVFDHTSQPAIAATVTLIKAKDSAVVKTTIVDVQGKFVLDQLPAGDFKLWITAVGFQKYRSALIKIGSATVALPAITLKAGGTDLKEVAVTAQKAAVEQKIDRVVVNVGASISNTGATALEALEKAPGVTVDANGNITFKGKTGTMVMIDDRPTYLSGEALANYLRSLPASSLDQIELMPNPPAKYDASGNAGVINIKTKKSKAKGFNGSFAASTGKAMFWRTNESLNINYRVNKVNLYATASYTFNNNYRRLDIGRHYVDATGAPKSNYTEVAFFYPKNNTPNIKMGIDYDLSPKTTIGLALTGGLTRGHIDNNVTSQLAKGNGQIDSTILAQNGTKNIFNNGGVNLYYNHKYDSLGKEISFNLDYLNYYTRRDQDFVNASYNAAGTISANQHITDTQPGYLKIYSAKTDFTQPLKNKAKLAFGLKGSYVDIDNAANYFNVVNNVSTVDLNMTNRFLYNENVNAAYLNFNQDFKRLSVQLGLRGENTNLKGHQLGNGRSPDSTFVQHYTSLFPTGYVLYKLDSAGNNTINFSYGRRIDRPYYQDLNPFVVIIDKFSQFTGNPFLKPQYVSFYELTYSYKNKFTVGAEYGYYTNYQTEYDYQKGDIFIATSVNLGERLHRNVSASTTLDLTKWWNFYLYVEGNYNTYRGPLGATALNFSTAYFYTSGNNQFTFKHGWSAEFSYFYQSPFADSQFTHVHRSQVNLGLQKKIFDNKVAVKAGVRDLFSDNTSAGDIRNVPNANITYHNDFANRVVTLGFTYNFGTTIKGLKKHDGTSADSELNRVRN